MTLDDVILDGVTQDSVAQGGETMHRVMLDGATRDSVTLGGVTRSAETFRAGGSQFESRALTPCPDSPQAASDG